VHVLFTIYISVIAPFRNVHHAQYADDTQLYIALSTDKALSLISDCFQSVHRWSDATESRQNPKRSSLLDKGRNQSPALLFLLQEQ